MEYATETADIVGRPGGVYTCMLMSHAQTQPDVISVAQIL